MMTLRLLLAVLTTAASVLAQDRARLAQLAEAQAAGDRFMGAVLVAKDGEVVFEHAYGSANVEWDVPNTPTTKFRIGSVTKQFTAAAILLLEERGQLSTDDPVSNFVPDAPAAWDKVTVYHLLTHTSGIPSFTDLPDYGSWKLTAPTAARTVAHFRDLPLQFPPGEKFVYSNSGYLLLGYIIERVSGQNYETFMREHVFGPLGLEATGYDWNAAIVPQRAAGYVPSASGLANAPYIDMHVPHAAGALYSTVGDLQRWSEGLFGGKLLSPTALAKMTKPFQSNYACGLFVRTVNGRRVVEHGGGIEGFNSQLTHYPDEGLTIAVLANVNGPAASELTRQLAAVALGEIVTLPSERQDIAVSADLLRDYVGVYQLAPRITNTIRLTDGQLTTQLSGQPAFPLFAESETKFFLKIVDAQVEFFRGPDGRVTHLVQSQNGRDQTANRINDTVVERKAIELPRQALEKLVGAYELQPGFVITVTLEGNQLMAQATGQANFPLFPESETTFFYKVVDAQLEFFSDDTGAITHAVLHQGGQDMKAPRLAP